MKYAALKNEETKTFSVGELSKGIKKRDLGEKHLNGAAENLENLYFCDGILKSRKGLNFKRELAMFPFSMACAVKQFSLSETKSYIEGKVKKIAYAVFCDDECDAEVDVAFIGEDGDIVFAKPLVFLRFDFENFYQPISVNFFNAVTSERESGLYMTVLRENERQERRTEIYRLNTDTSGYTFFPVSETRYHSPIILLNGTGNSYFQAVEEKRVDKISPIAPESMNLYTGWCRNYFSCDGCSYQFKTSCNGFSDDHEIIVEYFGIVEKVRLVIPPGEISVSASEIEEGVWLNCNRRNGSISFTRDGYGPYPLPLYYECSNNLYVEAYARDFTASDERISSAKGSVGYNKRAYFYNNCRFSNEICCMDLRKSFYAPQEFAVKVGNDHAPITAIKEIAGKLFVFKPNEIYTLDVDYGKQITYTVYPLSLNETVHLKDTVTTKCLNNNSGCNLPKTIVCGKDFAVFLGENKTLYRMDLSGKTEKIADLSEALDDISSDDLCNAAAVLCEDNYVVCVKNVIAVANIKDASCFKLCLPKEVSCETLLFENGSLILGIKDDRFNVAYFSRLEDEFDSIICDVWIAENNSQQCVTEYKKIHSKFYSREYAPYGKEGKKNFEEMLVYALATKGFFITFDGLHKMYIPPQEKFKTLKICPHLPPMESIQFKIETDAELMLGNVSFKYKARN